MRRLSLVIAETTLLLVVGLTAAYLRLTHNLSYELSERQGWLKLILTTLVIQLSFYLFDLYSLPATRDYHRVVINLVKALGAATVLLAILFFALPVLELGRGVFLVNLALTFVAISAWRKLVAWSTGHPQLGVRERVLILGSGKQAIEVAQATLERRNAGFHVVGFADNKPELTVVGKTLPQLQNYFTTSISEFIKDPRVTVALLEVNSAKIGVLGEVRTPGVIIMNRPLRVLDAITAAGGITDLGNASSVSILRQYEDGRVEMVTSNVKKILKGKADPEENAYLRAGDTIIVHGNLYKKIGKISGLVGVTSFITFLTSGGR